MSTEQIYRDMEHEIAAARARILKRTLEQLVAVTPHSRSSTFLQRFNAAWSRAAPAATRMR